MATLWSIFPALAFVLFHPRLSSLYLLLQIASMALGGFLAAVCIYGALAPLTCRGAKDDHLKVSYVLLLLALIVFIAFTLLSILNSGDAQNLNTMLDYGWQKAFSGTGKGSQNAITSAQLAGKCCGYNSPSDRPIAPCPPGAAVGCASFLQGQLKQQLGFVGMLFAAGAGACLLVMAVSHGWIERISFDRVKASSASGAGSASSANFSAYSGLDGSRAPMRGPNDPRAAQAMGLRREPVRASGSLPASMVKRGTAGMSFAGGDGAGGGLGDPNPLLGGSSSGAGSVKRR